MIKFKQTGKAYGGVPAFVKISLPRFGSVLFYTQLASISDTRPMHNYPPQWVVGGAPKGRISTTQTIGQTHGGGRCREVVYTVNVETRTNICRHSE